MTAFAHTRNNRLKVLRGLLLPIMVFCYFLYHALNGNRSLPARTRAEAEHENLTVRLQELVQRRTVLQIKLHDLGDNFEGRIDPDLLSEMLRKPGFIRRDEYLLQTSDQGR